MNHQQQVNTVIQLLEIFPENQNTVVSMDSTLLVNRLHQSDHLSVHLLTQSQLPADKKGRSLAAVARQISELYNETDLRLLCLTLGTDIEELEGEDKLSRCVSLVQQMQRYGRLDTLLAQCKRERPHRPWPEAAQLLLPDIIKKEDLAVVLGLIPRRAAASILKDVATYADKNGLEANFLFFASSGAIPLDMDWNLFPRVFRDSVDQALSKTGARRGHFFLAGPNAVFFSMGCMWSTINQGTIYHKDSQIGYHPVITIP